MTDDGPGSSNEAMDEEVHGVEFGVGVGEDEVVLGTIDVVFVCMNLFSFFFSFFLFFSNEKEERVYVCVSLDSIGPQISRPSMAWTN